MANIGHDADIAHGFTIGWDSDTYAVRSFDGPSMAADAPDSSHSQTTNGWRTFIEGMLDAGEVSCELNFAAAEVPTMGGGVKSLVMNFPDTTTCTVDAILTGYSPSGEVDGVMTASLTWKLSGEPVWA